MITVPPDCGADIIRPGTPQLLFDVLTGPATTAFPRIYDVSRHGRRSLTGFPVADADEPPITLVLKRPKLAEKK